MDRDDLNAAWECMLNTAKSVYKPQEVRERFIVHVFGEKALRPSNCIGKENSWRKLF
jgi:hypothetical protein